MESEKYPPDRLLAAIAPRNATTFSSVGSRIARALGLVVRDTHRPKLLHFSFNAKGDMFGGVAFGRLRNRRT